MNNRSDKQQESMTYERTHGLELSQRQIEIHRNLEAIGPEIAAFYLDGIRILQNEDLETAANLLAHITREIDGGLRNILSEERKEELEFVVSMPDGSKLTCEGRKEGSFKFASEVPGTVKVTYKQIGKHKASILQWLGIDDPSPLAERWLKVTGKFHKFAHRHGAWETPRRKEVFIPLWNEFEDVLADLVGNYLNLLIKVVDRILAYEEPTNAIRKVLPNLLKSEARCKYFFERLDSPAWLLPLREDGWFEPESNISVKHGTVSVKNPDQSDWWAPLKDAEWFDQELSSLTKVQERSIRTRTFDIVSPWHPLEYVERIAENTKNHPRDAAIDILVEIVDAIVNCAEDIAEKIIKDNTLSWRMIRIISALPEDRQKKKHCLFMSTALEVKQDEMAMPARFESPEMFYELEQWAKDVDLMINAFSDMPNSRIAALLQGFKGEKSSSMAILTEQELAGLLKACVVKTHSDLWMTWNCFKVFFPSINSQYYQDC